jgi:hypothetical protein
VGSNDASSESTVEGIVDVAVDQGLSWLVITDHSNSSGSMDCDDVEDCPNSGPEFPASEAAGALSSASFVVAVGSELSPIETLDGGGAPVGHIGCLPPADGFSFTGGFEDRPPGALNGAATLAQCRDISGFTVVNHPFAQASWIRWDWSSSDFDGIEVWNAGLGWDPTDERALWAWECLVSGGRSVVPIATSDSHDAGVTPGANPLSPAIGEARTSVLIPTDGSLSWVSLRQGLGQGSVTLHDRNSFVSLQEIRGSVGGSEQWTVVGKTASRAYLQLRDVPRDSLCLPEAVTSSIHQVIWETEVDAEFTVVAEEIPKLDRVRSVGRYLFLEQIEREPLSGGVALTGLLTGP